MKDGVLKSVGNIGEGPPPTPQTPGDTLNAPGEFAFKIARGQFNQSSVSLGIM